MSFFRFGFDFICLGKCAGECGEPLICGLTEGRSKMRGIGVGKRVAVLQSSPTGIRSRVSGPADNVGSDNYARMVMFQPCGAFPGGS